MCHESSPFASLPFLWPLPHASAEKRSVPHSISSSLTRSSPRSKVQEQEREEMETENIVNETMNDPSTPGAAPSAAEEQSTGTGFLPTEGWTTRIHVGWEASSVAMARCDFCQLASRGIVLKCNTCKLSICKECFDDGRLDNNVTHQINNDQVNWKPVIKTRNIQRATARGGRPRVARPRGRTTRSTTARSRGQASLSPAISSVLSAPYSNLSDAEWASMERELRLPDTETALNKRHVETQRNLLLRLDRDRFDRHETQTPFLPRPSTSSPYSSPRHRDNISSPVKVSPDSLESRSVRATHQQLRDLPRMRIVDGTYRHTILDNLPESSEWPLQPDPPPPFRHDSRYHEQQRQDGAAAGPRLHTFHTRLAVPEAPRSPPADDWPPGEGMERLANYLMDNAVLMQRSYADFVPLDFRLRDEVAREWATGELRRILPDDGHAFRYLLGATYIATIKLDLNTATNAARLWLCEKERVLCAMGYPPIRHMPTKSFIPFDQ